jgi:hypothetical protein
MLTFPGCINMRLQKAATAFFRRFAEVIDILRYLVQHAPR